MRKNNKKSNRRLTLTALWRKLQKGWTFNDRNHNFVMAE